MYLGDLSRRLRKCVYDKEDMMREDRLLPLELVVLEELGFNLSVFDPYTPLQKFLKNPSRADAEDAGVLTAAWGLLNDSLVRTGARGGFSRLSLSLSSLFACSLYISLSFLFRTTRTLIRGERCDNL